VRPPQQELVGGREGGVERGGGRTSQEALGVQAQLRLRPGREVRRWRGRGLGEAGDGGGVEAVAAPGLAAAEAVGEQEERRRRERELEG